MPKVMNYLGIQGGRNKGDNRADEQVFIDHIKDNLLHLYNSVSPEYRARAKQWYVGANRLSQQAADKYGLALHQVAGVMASLSPQKDWYMNYDFGHQNHRCLYQYCADRHVYRKKWLLLSGV
jgi:hypothetical protein